MAIFTIATKPQVYQRVDLAGLGSSFIIPKVLVQFEWCSQARVASTFWTDFSRQGARLKKPFEACVVGNSWEMMRNYGSWDQKK